MRRNGRLRKAQLRFDSRDAEFALRCIAGEDIIRRATQCDVSRVFIHNRGLSKTLPLTQSAFRFSSHHDNQASTKEHARSCSMPKEFGGKPVARDGAKFTDSVTGKCRASCGKCRYTAQAGKKKRSAVTERQKEKAEKPDADSLPQEYAKE